MRDASQVLERWPSPVEMAEARSASVGWPRVAVWALAGGGLIASALVPVVRRLDGVPVDLLPPLLGTVGFFAGPLLVWTLTSSWRRARGARRAWAVAATLFAAAALATGAASADPRAGWMPSGAPVLVALLAMGTSWPALDGGDGDDAKPGTVSVAFLALAGVAATGTLAAAVVMVTRCVRGEPAALGHWAALFRGAVGLAFAWAAGTSHRAALRTLSKPETWEPEHDGVRVPLDDVTPGYRATERTLVVRADADTLRRARDDVRVTRAFAAWAFALITAAPLVAWTTWGRVPDDLRLFVSSNVEGSRSWYAVGVEPNREELQGRWGGRKIERRELLSVERHSPDVRAAYLDLIRDDVWTLPFDLEEPGTGGTTTHIAIEAYGEIKAIHLRGFHCERPSTDTHRRACAVKRRLDEALGVAEFFPAAEDLDEPPAPERIAQVVTRDDLSVCGRTGPDTSCCLRGRPGDTRPCPPLSTWHTREGEVFLVDGLEGPEGPKRVAGDGHWNDTFLVECDVTARLPDVREGPVRPPTGDDYSRGRTMARPSLRVRVGACTVRRYTGEPARDE